MTSNYCKTRLVKFDDMRWLDLAIKLFVDKNICAEIIILILVSSQCKASIQA